MKANRQKMRELFTGKLLPELWPEELPEQSIPRLPLKTQGKTAKFGYLGDPTSFHGLDQGHLVPQSAVW